MDIETAVKYALDGEAILFLGAGFSIGGTNKQSEPLPNATKLSYQMCKALGINEVDDLSIISERFIEDKKIGKGIEKFIKFLKERMVCIDTSLSQDTIVSLPWLRIYTTNYDNIIELSSKKQNIQRNTITATSPKYSIDNINGSIVHMNGFILNVNVSRFYDEFKITSDSYIKQGFLSSSWGSQFTHDINNCKAIIFIGYSMKYDLELQRVMHSKINEKAIFIDRKDIDDNNQYLLEKWGKLYNIETAGFVNVINEIKKNYNPKIEKQELKSFKEINIYNYIESNINASHVINLFASGIFNKFWFRTDSKYLIKRTELLEKIKDHLENHQICIIHSNFGNGKSLFLDYLASQLVEENNIYYLENNFNILDDIRLISKQKTSVNILLIDDYDLHLNVFKEITNKVPENIKIIATCRTSINDSLFEKLINDYNFSFDKIAIENIEILSNAEREQLIEIFDQYVLWGKYANYSKKEKKVLINKKYKNRLSHIFYMLLDSKVIKDKLDDIFSNLHNETIKKYVFALSICSICGFKLKTYELARLIDIPISSLEKASLSHEFKEIFLKSSDSIELRSSVFSQYIINEINNYELIREILNTLFITSLQSNKKNEYFDMRKKLISRSNLIEIYGGKKINKEIDIDKEIYQFYDDIRPHSRDNPFYWLQFAITALNLEYYPHAKIYFDNAYSFASGLEGFDSFQLDTHHARYLFVEITKIDSSFDFMKFEKAHRLLLDNSNEKTKLAYVLRQISSYYDIDKKYKNNFTVEERMIFINYLKEVIKKLEEYFTYVESQQQRTFYFAIEKSVRPAYKIFRNLLLTTFSPSYVDNLDKQYNKLVNSHDRVSSADRKKH